MRPLPNPLKLSLNHKIYIKKLKIDNLLFYFTIVDFFEAGEVYMDGYPQYLDARANYHCILKATTLNFLDYLKTGRADRITFHLIRTAGIKAFGYDHSNESNNEDT
jgi:hypothetical protein